MSDIKPKNADTIIHARWIIPIKPARTIYDHHSIVISDGKIIDLLPHTKATTQYSAKQVIDLPNHLLTPGLINAHGHSAMALFRGMADDAPLDRWLEDSIWPAEAQWVSEEFVQDGTQLAMAEMLRSGTTTFSDMYFFPEVTAKASSKAGMRAQMAFPIFDFPSAWGSGPDQYIDKGLVIRDDFKHSDLISVVFGPHAPYTVNDQTMQKIAMLSAELDTGIHIHVHETQQEVDTELSKSGKRPLGRLNDLGILGPRTQLVHMTAINDEDIETVKLSGSSIIHCPHSNLKLASGFCPVEQLIANDINVAIGTDSAASNNSLDLFAEMRTAALLAKATSADASAMSDWEALEAATLSGAKTLGIDNKVGSLELGKQADIIAIDFSQIEQQPIYQPISQLVYTNCGQLVNHSWVNGQQVLKNRQPTQLDLNEITAKANLWRDKIKS